MNVNALTDVGLVRKDNEDCYLVSAERGLFVVADGMGGHEGGEIASSLAIKVIDEEIQTPHLVEDPSEMLQGAILRANNLVLTQSQEGNYPGMGTTLTAALLHHNLLYIAHIGDSRAYLCRDGELSLLTQDHSYVNELVRNGSLTYEEAQHHPQRNILTRALGTQICPQIDLFSLPLKSHDYILLCTDGLTNLVLDQEIEAVLLTELTLREKVNKLVRLALDRGGNDNITVVLLQYA